MKERGILFKGEMVRASLEDRKTQTRRVVHQQPPPDYPHGLPVSFIQEPGQNLFRPMGTVVNYTAAMKMGIACPYGVPGDRLWVRETWQTLQKWDDLAPRNLPDDPDKIRFAVGPERNPLWAWGKMRPGIFLPRWASRLILEIVSVRVERVQAISEADALAEGCNGDCPIGYIPAHRKAPCGYHFAQLWDSINVARGFGWEANPFVWVVEFKRIP